MTTDMYDENLILGYVEDTLTLEERTSFEQLMQTDAQLASLVASMCQDRELLSDLDQVTAPMELGDYVSAQLERQMLLGPLPKRRHAIPSNRSTPQSRSHSRFMRIWAYGSLAAMFLIVVGLMYQHIGHQSLIERTENLSFKTESTGDTTVAMKQSLPTDSAIDDIIKLPAKPKVAVDAATTSGLRLDEAVQPRVVAEVQALSPAPTAAPVLRSKEQAPAAQPIVALGTSLGDAQDKPTAQRSSMARSRSVIEDFLAEKSAPKRDKAHTLKELSPTTAALGREVDADRYAAIANQPTVASTPAVPAPAPASVTSDQLLSWDSNTASDDGKSRFSAVTGVASKPAQSNPPTVDLFTAESTAAGSQFVAKGTTQNEVVATTSQLSLQNQQQSVCVIQSSQPQDTVNQITQWAIRNQVQIIEPAVAQPTKDKLAKATDDKPATEQARAESEKKKMDLQLQRQVITLNMHANQVPVLVQWLNGQHNQLNNWIAPMPQSHTTNETLQRLQQELPLAPTIPFIKPDEVMAVQLMIVPDPRNSQTTQPPAK